MKAVVIFALVLLGAFVVGRFATHAQIPTAAEPAARPAVKIVSSSCDPNYGRPKAEYVVRNAGQSVSFLRGFVRVGANVHAGYFRPENVPADGMATLTVYGAKGDPATCNLEAIQNGDGVEGNIL